MSSSSLPIVILGSGQAGLQIADSLRREGCADEIVLIGEEAGLPYPRPPLSKDYLAGKLDENRLRLRPPEWFERNKVEVMTGAGMRVVHIDRASRQVVTASDRTIPYAKLAMAVGSRARRLPVQGHDLTGVHLVRTKADSRHLREDLASAERVVIAGGGFIGLEVAAVARGMGKDVTVLEMQERLMPRVMPPALSEFYRQLHSDRGVKIVLGARIEELEGDDRVRSVRVAGGDHYFCDLAVVGIGSAPNEEIARASGIACANGITVDEFCRTSDPDIVASGDCTNHPNRWFRGRVRLESVQNAVDQSKTAAATLIGRPKAYDALPWFWSDQYDVSLQMTGASIDFDTSATRGDVQGASFSTFYYKQGQLIGVDSINSSADHLTCRRLLSAGVTVSSEQAADTSYELKSALPA